MIKKIFISLFFAVNLYALTDAELQQVRFIQYPGKELPLELEFTDADGKIVHLRDFFRGTPVILIPGYYRCTMLCDAVSDGLRTALRDVRKDYRVVFFSINAQETLDDAKKKRAEFGVKNGCDVLIGNSGEK